MKIPALILTLAVAFEHLSIAYIEIFAWETLGRKTFRDTLPKLALIDRNSHAIAYLLACITAAGLYAGITASRSILYKQALPAALALAAHFLT